MTSSGPLGGLLLLGLAGLITWAWYAGILSSAINGAAAALTTPPARRQVTIPGAKPDLTTPIGFGTRLQRLT